MLDMPKWLTDVLVQFPILVVIGLVAWYAYSRVELLTQEAIRQAAADKREFREFVERQQARVLAAKEREVERLADDLRAEVKAVGRKVDALSRKLS